MGTIVNATAGNYVHGAFTRPLANPASHWQSAQTTPHVTLLDEAGVAPKIGINVAFSSGFMPLPIHWI